MTVEPIIYTRNYVDGYCSIAVTSNSTDKALAYDRDNSSVWQTSGENSDATESIYDVTFYDAGGATNRTIDTIILVNHNFKAPTLEYLDGSLTWQTLASGSSLTASTTIFTFNSISVSRVRVRNSTTQITNAEKYLGEFIACATQITFAKDIPTLDSSHREKSAQVELGDGSIHKTTVLWSPTRSDKYGVHTRFDFLTTTLLESLRSLKSGGQAFLWQPESVSRPDQIYLVNWYGDFKYRYMSSYKGAGIQLDADFREV
jgi:hypothetical protein